jgi:hypothetical protein
MIANGDTLYQFEAQKFAFAETRYINAHIDYEYFFAAKSRFQKTFVDPGNHLSMYPVKKQRGVLEVQPNQNYDIVIEAADFGGNVSRILFTVVGNSTAVENLATEPAASNWVRYNHPFTFQTDLVKINIPSGTLYKDQRFSYQKENGTANLLTPWHKIMDGSVPAHAYFNIGIFAEAHIREFGDKACVVSRSASGGLVYEGGTWKGNFLHADTRSFGHYGIAVDTVPPAITPVNIRQNAVLTKASEIRVRITDNLSGIQSYEPSIDGNWVLMDYDAKNNLLTYEFDEMCPKGAHTFQIKVTDKRGNQSTYRANFTR